MMEHQSPRAREANRGRESKLKPARPGGRSRAEPNQSAVEIREALARASSAMAVATQLHSLSQLGEGGSPKRSRRTGYRFRAIGSTCTPACWRASSLTRWSPSSSRAGQARADGMLRQPRSRHEPLPPVVISTTPYGFSSALGRGWCLGSCVSALRDSARQES